MLRFENVFFDYGNVSTINDVSFHIKPGEFVVLLGENGAGKSTLCRLANGLLKPEKGRVLLDGEDTAKTKASLLAKKAAFLFQNPDRQLCQNTVRAEISFGLETDAEERTNEMLQLFSLDGDAAPFGLSRGERQICALASVLARKPPLLILDEPTTGLDFHECVLIMEKIIQLNKDGSSVLMITHDMEIACDYAERALALSGGRLIGDGTVKTILKNKDIIEKASLLPPQIAQLAGKLGKEFEDAFYVDDVVSIVEHKKGKAS